MDDAKLARLLSRLTDQISTIIVGKQSQGKDCVACLQAHRQGDCLASRTDEIMRRMRSAPAMSLLALLALAYLYEGVEVTGFAPALAAALVIGLFNTLLRPILVLLTLPATVLTLGLFLFVINALLFWFVASFVDGFAVGGFASAFLGALVYSVVSTLLAWLLVPRAKP